MINKRLALYPLTGVLVTIVFALIIVRLVSGNEGSNAPSKDQFTPTVLSPEEVATREAQHSEQLVESERLLSRWLAEFERSGVNVSTLKKVDIHAEPARPPSTFEDAVDASDIIAVGTIVAMSYENISTILTVRLDESVKGDSLDEVVVTVLGGPRPASGKAESFDRTDVVLIESAGWPMPFQGERVFFFLEKIEESPEAPPPSFRDRYGVDEIYRAISYVGINRIESGRLVANSLLDYHGELDGLTEAEALDKVRSLLPN